jgi:hypothetical protein
MGAALTSAPRPGAGRFDQGLQAGPGPAARAGRGRSRSGHRAGRRLAARMPAWRVPGCGVRGRARRRGRLRGGHCASGPARPGLARLRCGRCHRWGASAPGRAPRLRSASSTFRARWPRRRLACHARPERPSSGRRRSCWARRHDRAVAADDLVARCWTWTFAWGSLGRRRSARASVAGPVFRPPNPTREGGGHCVRALYLVFLCFASTTGSVCVTHRGQGKSQAVYRGKRTFPSETRPHAWVCPQGKT